MLPVPIGLSPITSLLSGAASSVAGDVVTMVAKAIVGSLLQLAAAMSTLWISVVPSPTVGDATTGSAAGTSAVLQADLVPIVSLVVVGSIIVGGVKIAIEEQKYEQGRHLMAYIVRFVVWSTLGGGLCALLVAASDSIADFFVAQASSGSVTFGDHVAQMLGLAASGGGAAGFLVGLAGALATAFLAILLGLWGLIASFIEIVIMFMRSIMLILLVGTLPLAAACSNSDMGRQWLKKSIAWIIAFACYKPAAAVLYAAAFQFGVQGSSVVGLVEGFTVLLMSVLALPAMLRFLVPLTASLTAGGSSAAAYIAGAGGMLYANSGRGGPTGAVQSSTTGDPATSAGPTGADTTGSSGADGAIPPSPSPGGGAAGDSQGSAGVQSSVTGAMGAAGSTSAAAQGAADGAVREATGEPGTSGAGGSSGNAGQSGPSGSTGKPATPGVDGRAASGQSGPSGGAPGGSAGGGGGAAAGGAAGAL